MKQVIVAMMAAVAGVGVSHAASGTWVGGSGNAWATDANWSAAPYPQGDEAAAFGSANAGVIDLSGLSGIQSLLFSGAAFTLGTGGTGAQSLTWRHEGAWTLGSGAAAQVVAADVVLGQDGNSGGFVIENNSTAALSFAGNVTGGGASGVKTLTVRGSGPVEIAGNLAKGAVSGLDVAVEGSGTVSILGGASVVRQINLNGPAGGVLDIGAGNLRFENGGNVNLRSLNSATINGTGSITFSGGAGDDHADNGAIRADAVQTINVRLTGPAGYEYWIGNNDAAGMVVFNAINDFQGSVAINSAGTISANIIGNQGSLISNLGQGTKIVFNGNGTGSGLRYTGTGETTDRIMQIPKSARFEMSGTGRLVFATPFTLTGGGGSMLYLSGSTAGTAEIAGGLGSASYGIQKSGDGTWVLSGVNAFNGAVNVTGGTLALANTNAVGGTVNVSNGARLVLEGAGHAQNVAGVSLAGGSTLEISNTAAANFADRVSASMALGLQAGILALTHDAAAGTDYSAALGAVTVGTGVNTIQTLPAATGRANTLHLGNLIDDGGVVNFVGADLGDDDRNRIFISGMPEGLIGPWAFVNGASMAAYDYARGVYASSDTTFTYRDIDAWGDTIPDAPTENIRIAQRGAGAEFGLAQAVTSVARLVHDTDTNAVVVMAGKTLQTSTVKVNSGADALTLGEDAGDGTLTALPNGTLLTLDNASASTLRVNADITDNGVPLSLVKLGAGPVRLSGALEYTGATTLVGDGLALDTAEAAVFSSVVSGIGAWSKMGQGTLRIGAANTFLGTFTVREGAVIPGVNQAFGDPAGTVVIADGAALDLNNGMAQNDLTLNKTFIMSGFGQERKGAVVNSGAMQYNAFGKVRLAADTGFGGPNRWDFRSNTPTLWLDGHTFHKTDVNEIALVSATVNADRADGTKGRFDVERGTLTLEANTNLGGDSGNTLTVRGGATLHFWGHNNPPYWSLVMEPGAHFGAGSGGGGTQNTWRGPFEIQGHTWFDRAATKAVESGITGPGSICHTDGTTYLKGTNIYDGVTIVSNGTLFAWTPYALPGWEAGSVTGAGGTMVLRTGDGENGWTKEQILAYKDASTLFAPHWFGVDTTQAGLELDGLLDGTFSFAKYGAGHLALLGGLDISGRLSVVGAPGSVLTLAAGTSNACTGINVSGGADAATLNVDGPVYMVKTNTAERILVSNNANGRSYLNINADIDAGGLFAGNASNAFAAVVHNSGTVEVAPENGGTDVLVLGANNFGYGYYRMNGGKVLAGQISTTGQGQTGTGVLDMFGGEMSVTNGWFINAWGGGSGIVNLYGGTLASYATGGNGVHLTDNAGKNAFSMFNVLGAGALVDFSLRASTAFGVDMAKSGGNTLSAVNLNAGTMITKRVYATADTTPTFLNFNGGTLAASETGVMLINGSLTAATIYDGGATIDTGANDVMLAQPLLAPADHGVSGVSLASPGANYMGPPAVRLTGGSGTGALAIATIDFDPGSPGYGKLTGFTVTAPGTGYEAGDTLTATLAATLTSSGGSAEAGSVTLAPHAQTGGLTKRGTGSLLLMGGNTYKGVTHVQEGTLRVTQKKIGLYEGTVTNPGADINTNAPSPKAGIQLGTRMANTDQGWPNNTTYIYTGYVWNNTGAAKTWTFVKSFDDAIYLLIDGNEVTYNDNWAESHKVSYLMTPGPHEFEVRFGQGGGGVGPVSNRGWWTTPNVGFAYDPLGRDSQDPADYIPMIDPGDGSLFTLTASPDDTIDPLSQSSLIIVDAGATLDLGGGAPTIQNLSGDGTVVNGTLTINGDLMPGGNGNIGTLTFNADLALTATYHADVLPDGTSDLVIVNGNASLSQMALHVIDTGLLSRNKSHTILTASGTVTGAFTSDNLPNAWQIRYTPNSVKIAPSSGTMIILR